MTNHEMRRKAFELFGDNSLNTEILRLRLSDDNLAFKELFQKMIIAEIHYTEIKIESLNKKLEQLNNALLEI